MANESLDPGLYINIFPVQVADAMVDVMIAEPSAYPNLEGLREAICAASRKLRVYRVGSVILGYGSDLDWLANKRFDKQEISLYRYPQWCTRMIIEGLIDHLTSRSYREWSGKGRSKLYEPQPFQKAAQGQLYVFRGYDLRAIYWYREQRPLFGLIVDICWEIQDTNGKRLSTSEIAQYNALPEIARIQEEYLPDGRINPEVSRMRLQNHILPFVQQHSRFALPCDRTTEATLGDAPLRVILGV